MVVKGLFWEIHNDLTSMSRTDHDKREPC
jgi:hypothetical protein